jgi:hypothetical protein
VANSALRNSTPPDSPAREELHYESLKEATDHIEQEARMVLPGIQALFGFQLIAVFNSRFGELNLLEQRMHWLALAMTSIATVFTIAPAAYHRQAEPSVISRDFVKTASRWIFRGMSALAVGVCLDFYLIGRLITKSPLQSGVAALVLFALFKGYWTIYPAYKRRSASRRLD